ncbi:MAG: hypothetical protein KJO88_04315 [Gammaproteobacteria bacterium]|nr:hypothetical protein [Gammaproteobacteria bacterium]
MDYQDIYLYFHDSVYYRPLLAFELLGLDVRPIFGVRGRSAGRVAFEKDQVNIDFQTTPAYLEKVIPLVEEGKALPIFSLGLLDDTGKLVRDPAFPDLPHFGEVYASIHDANPRGPAWDSWLAFFTAGFGAQKFLVISKDTPITIRQAYKNAIESMLEDNEYQKQKSLVLSNYEQVTGETAVRLYELGTDVPDEAKCWMRAWLRREFKLNI